MDIGSRMSVTRGIWIGCTVGCISIGTLLYSSLSQRQQGLLLNIEEIAQSIEKFAGNEKRVYRVVVISDGTPFPLSRLNSSFSEKNKSRMSAIHSAFNREFDFAQFILLVYQQPKAPAEFKFVTSNWFRSTYKLVDEWTGEQGAKAKLYRIDPPVFQSAWYLTDSLSMNLGTVQLVGINLSNLYLSTKVSSEQKRESGHFNQIQFSCQRVDVSSISLFDVSGQLVNPVINIPLLVNHRRFQMLSVDELSVSARISFLDLSALIEQNAPVFQGIQLRGQGSYFDLKGRFKGVPFFLNFETVVQADKLLLRVTELRLFDVKIPRLLIWFWSDQELFLGPSGILPFQFKLKKIHGDGDYVDIFS